LSEVLDADIEIRESKNAREATPLASPIAFKEVTFGYEENKAILEKISFVIPSKAKIALIGHSGRGKTTIINLILRLYDVNEGAVFLGALNLKEIKFKSLYRLTGVALQDTSLFNDSALYNITYGEAKYGLEDAVFAAKIACAHEFIMDLSKGYQTFLGDGSCKISQGQRQRLAIARAVIKKPKILILDEAMSSLDSQTEDKIIENIKKELKDSTLITISHRLSTARNMEKVYFLKSSSCMDTGTHDELLERSVGYRELFASQIEAEKKDEQLKIAV
jgi:ABC-type multidrug transport system fused ATPase/permease subunit